MKDSRGVVPDRTRREFLLDGSRSALGIAAALTVGGAVPLGCGAGSSPQGGSALPFRISLAQWSLNKSLFGKVEPKRAALDFAAKARELGFDAIEYVNTFFFEKASDEPYLADLAKRADGEGVKSLLIMVDREGYLGDPDEAKRKTAVQNHRRWIEAAKRLGCHSIRVNAHSDGTYDEQIERAADGLAGVVAIGDEVGINVIVENHGGLSSNGAWLTSVIRKVDHPRCGTLPDFGNFRVSPEQEYDRYRGVEELMPFAKAVSAKSYDFDDFGNETTIDYRRMMEIVLAAGYDGYVGVEYEGGRLSEEDGIRATRELLERIRDESVAAPGNEKG